METPPSELRFGLGGSLSLPAGGVSVPLSSALSLSQALSDYKPYGLQHD